MESELFRRMSSKERVLARLQSGTATNVELNRICFRFGARIKELRNAGRKIEGRCVGNGVWEYWLRADGRLF
jgi:hypothetical protein